MSVKGGPNTVTSGLVLELDAGNIKSYPGSGTTWYDKSGNANNGTLTNRSATNPSWTGSYFTFDPTYVYGTYQYGSYVSFPDGQFARVQSQNRVTMSARIFATENSYPMIIAGNSYNGGIGWQGYQIWLYNGNLYGRITVNNTTTTHSSVINNNIYIEDNDVINNIVNIYSC